MYVPDHPVQKYRLIFADCIIKRSSSPDLMRNSFKLTADWLAPTNQNREGGHVIFSGPIRI